MLTLAEKGGRGFLATNDITDKMTLKITYILVFLKLIFTF